MSSIIDASNIKLDRSRILFDTNTWIFIYGFGANVIPDKVKAYSNAFSQLLKSTNRIVVNDYVLGEFCNKCARYEYDLKLEENPGLPKFKKYRASADFKEIMESIRDTCLHILDDCEYVRVGNSNCDARKAVEECCAGKMDFSDLILAEYCRLEKLFLMTDDADFAGCGVNLITYNKKLLRQKHRYLEQERHLLLLFRRDIRLLAMRSTYFGRLHCASPKRDGRVKPDHNH